MNKAPNVSVIIVNWNAGKYLQETIESLLEKTKDISYEVIIVDNKSNKEDESYKYIEKILENKENTLVIKSENNLGFAKANNMAMKIAKGRNFLILNPDVIFHNNVIKILSDYLDENIEVGMASDAIPTGSDVFIRS